MLYWTTDRRRATATVVAYGFTGYAAVLALRAWFALPRPPEPMAVIAATGYGFPSGHAAAATIVYGGLALEYGWRDGARLLAVGGLVAVVSLTCVLLGVHYLGDVLAGIVLGLVVRGCVRALADGDPARSFAVGLLAAVTTLVPRGVGARHSGSWAPVSAGSSSGRASNASGTATA